MPIALVDDESVHRHMCLIDIAYFLQAGLCPDRPRCGNPFYPTGNQVIVPDCAGNASSHVQSLDLDGQGLIYSAEDTNDPCWVRIVYWISGTARATQKKY